MVALENYNKVLSRFTQNHGKPMILFAVLKMDELIDKWSIILSADWINTENNREIFNDLINILQEELNKEQLNEVARIVFYSSDEHLVQLMLKQFREGQHIEEDAKVNGNVIHEGYIVALNNPDSID